MLTYHFENMKGPIYEYIYQCIKEDIISGKLAAGEKLPSKRTFAKNNGISTITIQNAYDQLIGEGYIYALPKKGYYVAEMGRVAISKPKKQVNLNIRIPANDEVEFDFSSNKTETKNFPFSTWAKIMRETISMREKDLLDVSFCGGVKELRVAIAEHLTSFRSMVVDPNQIVVGAGTEYLYGLLIKLLGEDKVYCIENPGYLKLKKIYESNKVACEYAGIDENGIMIDELRKKHAQIVHISPNHHFPTGITMPISNRYELLAWANEDGSRYIIEDDYDSEFRLNGKPISTLQSIDASGRVIYMNTFSKSLTSTVRISYMVLPEQLANAFYERLSFYSCTVSTFEQYSLAEFIRQGYFEKHINRMRLHYGRKRAKVLEMIRTIFLPNECKIIENDSGLHFLLQLNTQLSDQEIKRRLLLKKIKIGAITDYDFDQGVEDKHQFIFNYSNMDIERLPWALQELKQIVSASEGMVL